LLIFVRMAGINNIDLYKWANSILLGVVSFFVIQIYSIIQTDHDKLATHETRISVLEDWRRGSQQTGKIQQPIEAILPDKIKVKSE